MDFYHCQPEFSTFGRGWTNRVESIETVALGMARQAVVV
jgi:lysozyme family protein